MLHWRTTGSSSVAIKTGSIYICECDSMRDIITIPTANLLSERVCIKCQVTVTSMATGNCDMTAKTGNSYTTGTTTNSVKITTANQVFLTIVSPNKVSPSDFDNDGLMSKIANFPYSTPITAKIWWCFLWSVTTLWVKASTISQPTWPTQPAITLGSVKWVVIHQWWITKVGTLPLSDWCCLCQWSGRRAEPVYAGCGRWPWAAWRP